MERALEETGLSKYVEVFSKQGYDDLYALKERAQSGQDVADLLAKQLAEDLQMPIGHARKLVWHLQGKMTQDGSGLGAMQTKVFKSEAGSLHLKKDDAEKKEIKEEIIVKHEVKTEEAENLSHGVVPMQVEVAQSYYDVLQVDVSASYQEIRKSYKKLVTKCHPDKPGGSKESFQELEEAYEILSNDSERQIYDEKLGVRAKAQQQGGEELEYNLSALWSCLLKAGSNAWVSWLEALPTHALAGLHHYSEMNGQVNGVHGAGMKPRLRDDPASRPEMAQALVAAGVGPWAASQLRSDLQCGRDILLGRVNFEPEASSAVLVEDLVEAIGPAASRVFGNKHNRKQVDPETGAAALKHLLRELVRNSRKWDKRFRPTLDSNMTGVVSACLAAYAPCVQQQALQDTVREVVGATVKLQQTQASHRCKHGHYYPCGANAWVTKVVWKNVHMTTASSQDLAVLADARASLSLAKQVAESRLRAGKHFALALEEAICMARPQCQSPLVWKFSYDTREIGGVGMTPTTPLLEEMLRHREELHLQVGGGRLGSDIKSMCAQMRTKCQQDAKANSDNDMLVKAWASLRKCVKVETERRKLAPMLGWDGGLQDDNKSLPAQRRAADALAASLLHKHLQITKEHVEAVLELWGFEENASRQNVLPRGKSFVYSDILGAVKARSGEVHLTPPTATYPNFCRILCKYFQQNCPAQLDALPHTSICVNKGFSSRKHRDAHNDGPFAIEAFGPHEHGELVYWMSDDGSLPLSDLADSAAEVLDVRKMVIFDGRKARGTKAYKGKMRYSVVLYTIDDHHRLMNHQRTLLSENGFNVTTPASLACFKAVLRMCELALQPSTPLQAVLLQQLPDLASSKRSIEQTPSTNKKLKTGLPEGVLALTGRAVPFDLPDGWLTGFKFTKTGKKVKVAIHPDGRVFWDLRQARKACPHEFKNS